MVLTSEKIAIELTVERELTRTRLNRLLDSARTFVRTTMKLALKILYALLLAVIAWSSVLGQQPIARDTEFITSSSPLPDGSIVTTTYYPKLGVAPETRMTAGLGPIAASPFAVAAKPSIEPSVLQVNSAHVSLPTGQLPLAQTAQMPATLAPFQSGSMSPIVQVPTWGNPFAGPRRYLPSNYQPAGYNLGLPQVSAGYLPTGTVYPYPVAATPPTLNTAPVLLPPTFNIPAELPSASYPGPARANYQPLLRFQNLPPGSYLGQGMIGQPTAYVDGQPFRNLLRYVFP